MKHKPYPKYKDSGTEWLGMVPEGWKVKRVKYAAQLVNEKLDATETNLKFIGLEHIESWTGKRLNAESESQSEGQSNQFKQGDVLFGKLRPYLAKVLRVNEEGICTGELLVLRPNSVEQTYLFYSLLNREFISMVDASTYGVKMPRASWDFIGNIALPIPVREEQSRIAAFLDRETGRIDELISQKERQIELLQEKRQALISHAVTKGLDPNAKMKDSGIEWLGMVPEGWGVKKFKQVSELLNGYAFDSNSYTETGIPVIRIGDVGGQINWDDIKKVPNEYGSILSRFRIARGDILIAMTGATIGKSSVFDSDEPALLNQRVGIVRADSVKQPFLSYVMQSSSYIEFIDLLCYGGAQENIGREQLGLIPLAVPSDKEQNIIVKLLDRETVRIDELAGKIGASIATLREYRTALISAAVTGKIDVRGN